ncbi:MAG: LemA family protein [Methanobrevibacter sp.]|nr:LemA family protein [Methanobrevibacter sp.]
MVSLKNILTVIIVFIIALLAFSITGQGIVFFAVIVICALFYFSIPYYNKLVSKRNDVRNEWSKIDFQLNRRVDLIEKLIPLLRDYSIQENEALIKVTEARSNLVSSESIPDLVKSNKELTNSLSKLFAIVEKYPDLKDNENFLDIQNQLKSSGKVIARYGVQYNNAVFSYNNLCEQFPSNIIAMLFNFNLADLFEEGNDKK